MPKKIVLLDDDGVPARLRYEALSDERYDVHLATQHMPFFDTLVQMQPDLFVIHWSKFALVEAEILTLAANDALQHLHLFLLEPALDDDEWEAWDDRVERLWKAKLFPTLVDGQLEIQDFINLVNVYMDRPERSAAIPAGGLARTYSYPGGGLPTRPHIHWSLPFHEQVSICRPILVADHRVYFLDSEGSLCALAAESGKLLWSFSPGGEGNANEGERITAFCLQGQSALGSKMVYVASTHRMLYELDLYTGQIRQSWQTEYRVLELLPFGSFELLLVKVAYSHIFDPDIDPDAKLRRLPIPFGLKDEKAVGRHLTLYHHPGSNVVTMYGWYMINNNGEMDFGAIDMDGLGMRREWYVRSYMSPYLDCTPENEGQIGRIDPCNMPLLDETLYLSGNYLHFLEQTGARKMHEEMEEEEEQGYEYEACDALFALDPQNGAVKWRYASPSVWEPIRLVATSKQIFVVRKYGVEAVDVHTHQQCWRWKTVFGLRHALAADGLLYVLEAEGQIVALDLSTGQTRWSLQVDGKVIEDFSTIDNGTLYVATTHALYALRC